MRLPPHSRPSVHRAEDGYILITLILFVALLAIAITVMAPELSQQVKRDREEELVHRGVQYSRAIKHYVKKFGRYPTRIEDLENTNNVRFLRKRYKDPVTGKDFRILHLGEVQIAFGAGLAGATPAANLAAAAAAATAAGPFGGGNSAFGGGNSAFGGGNNAFGGGNSAFGGGNSAFGGGNSAFGGGNSAFGGGNSAFGGGNSTFGGGNSAFGGNSTFGQNSFGGASNTPPAGAAGVNSPTPFGTDATQTNPAQANNGTPDPNQATPGAPGTPPAFGQPGQPGAPGQGNQVFGGGGPIVGVASLSKDKTIRVFNKKDHYYQWQFIYDPSTDRGGLLTTPNQPSTQSLQGGQGVPGIPGTQPGQQNSPFGSQGSAFGSPGGQQPLSNGFQPGGGTQPTQQSSPFPQMPPEQPPQQ